MNTLVETIEKYTTPSSPVRLEDLIRELGITLDKKADLPPDIAGQLEKLADGVYKISINKADHYFRQRFTMAHELAHYVFHRDLIGDCISDNRLYRSVNSAVTEKNEVEANKFAASLLMPYRHIMKDYEDMEQDVQKVANKWQVSPKAMKIRLGIDP